MHIAPSLLLILLLLYFPHSAHGGTPFTISCLSGAQISSNMTLQLGVSYQLNLNFNSVDNPIPAGGRVQLQFSNHFNITASTLTDCQATTSNLVAHSPAACQPAYISNTLVYTITFTDIYPTAPPTQTYVSIKFKITNPWAQYAQTIKFFITDSLGGTLGSGSTIFNYYPSVMSGCSYASNSDTTGVSSTRTITFTPLVQLLANSYLQMTIPTWFASDTNLVIPYSVTCAGINNTDAPNLPCTNILGSTQVFNISNFILTNKPGGLPITITLSNLKNPWSLAPFLPIIFQIFNSDQTNIRVTQNCTDASQQVTKMNTALGLNFTLINNSNISTTYTGRKMQFLVNGPYPKSSGQLQINFPSSLSISYTLAVPGIIISQNATSLILSNLTNIDYTGGSNITINNGLRVITPPSSRPFTITFTTYTVINGVYYGIDTISTTLVCVTGTLSSASIVPVSKAVNAITSHTITFSLANALISGSYIGVVFPATLVLTFPSTCTSNNVLLSCSVYNTTFANISVIGSLASNTSLSLTFNSVINPSQAIITPSVAIYTYYDSGLDSMVDKLTSGLTVSINPNLITVMSVTPHSFVTYANTNYDITATLIDKIIAGGSISITFPPTVTFTSPTLVSASFLTTNCSVTIATNRINLIGCFTSDMNNLTVAFTLGGIFNPPSLLPSASFGLITNGPAGQINNITNGPTVTMITPATSASFSITTLSSIVHAYTQYNLTINTVNPHISGDYFYLTIPLSMSFSVAPSCSSISGIASVSCSMINSTVLVVNYTATPTLNTTKISITSIRNYDVSGTNIQFQIVFYDSLNYAMQISPVFSVSYTTQSIISFAVNNNDQIALYQNSNITLTISSPFSLHSSFDPSLTSLFITIPSQFSLTANTTCTPLSGSCSLNSTTYQISPVGLSLSNFTVTIMNINLPFITTTSTSFSLAYKYNGLNIATLSSAMTVSPYCTSPCQRCTLTKIVCATCLPSPNTAIYLFSSNSTCLTVCSNGYYPNSNNVCTVCVDPCSFCLDSQNCTKCVAGKWLYEFTCVSFCPLTYYNDTSGACLSCQSPCGNCTALNVCLSCVIDFYYNFSCVTSASCPAGTYSNSTTRACQPCQSPCKNCAASQLGCTSCVTTFIYYNSSCLLTCPYTLYNSSNSCVPCGLPCGNCTSSTICLSCLINFLSNGSCVNASSCLVGTYADNTSNTCSTCPVGCTSCSALLNCSTCSSLFVFYNSQCLSSCPNTTFQSGSNCIQCSTTCLNCILSASKCSSCNSPQLLYNNTCLSTCPNGTFTSTGSCLTCLTTCFTCSNATSCITCSGSTYLSNGLCQSSCPAGTFSDSITNQCITCNPQCGTCFGSAANCTGCGSSLIMMPQTGSCLPSCPVNYFNVSGVCKTCGNCITCLSAFICQTCTASYFILVGVCYGSCPSNSISDILTYTCIPCDSTCRTCSGSTTSCNSCNSGQFLYNSKCISSCPDGLVQDPSTNECSKSTLGSIVYFPCGITFLVWFIIVMYSKHRFEATQAVTALCGGLSVIMWVSWLILVFSSYGSDIKLLPDQKNVILGMGVTGIVVMTITGISFNCWLKKTFRLDHGFNEWASHSEYNLNTYKVLVLLSLFSFPAFRLIYSRFFKRNNFSCFFVKGGELLSASNWLAFLVILASIFPLIGVSSFIIYIKQTYDQSLIFAIDVLVLSLLEILFLIMDMAGKDEDFFDCMLDGQNYLKRLKYDQLDGSISSLRSFSQGRQKRHNQCRSQLCEEQVDQFFRRKVNFTENLNKFGHLNELPKHQQQITPRRVKTVPEDIQNYPQFDPNEDELIVVNEDLFFEQEQARRKKQQQELQEQQRIRQLKEKEEQLRREEEEKEAKQNERKRKLMQEDMDEQQSVQFPDLAAIEKVQNKGENLKKSPTHILNNFKKVDDKAIPQKAKKKLQQVAKKNGIDPTFMANTFAIQKHHNPELLNSIIDIHNHVDRNAVKQLFSQNSNPEILQQLFSKTSTLNAQKLRDLMNDPQAKEIIANLIDEEKGILAPQLVKQLMDNNSKFGNQFVKELLSGSSGMDPEKMKEILRDQPDKTSRQAALKAIKKIGGDKLQNKELLTNMLGEESVLQPSNFTRVVNDLPKKVVQKLFAPKTEAEAAASKVLIDKLLNNKKIDLKNLSEILDDPALMQNLANALSHQNKYIHDNLINLFKNGQKLDPNLLSQLLANPSLMEKLLSQPIDPAFLTSMLQKDAKTDLKILEKTIQNMSADKLAQIFQFSPQKNVDFQKLAKLFEANPKTDPQLIAKMLQPDILASVYSKSSTARPEMLNKLVQKGKEIDPNSIIKIYGEDKVFNPNDPANRNANANGMGGGVGNGNGIGGQFSRRNQDINLNAEPTCGPNGQKFKGTDGKWMNAENFDPNKSYYSPQGQKYDMSMGQVNPADGKFYPEAKFKIQGSFNPISGKFIPPSNQKFNPLDGGQYGKLNPITGQFEPVYGKFDPSDGHFARINPSDGKFYPLEGKYNPKDGKFYQQGQFSGADGKYYPPPNQKFNPKQGKYGKLNPVTGKFQAIEGDFDPSDGQYAKFNSEDGTFYPIEGVFNPIDQKFYPKEGSFNPILGKYIPSKDQKFNPLDGGQYGKLNPLTGKFEPVSGNFDPSDGQYAKMNPLDGNFYALEGTYNPKDGKFSPFDPSINPTTGKSYAMIEKQLSQNLYNPALSKYGNLSNKKYNITDNNFNLNKDNYEQMSDLGFKKGINENAMSRTDGRMMGFLSPIQVGLQKGKKISRNRLVNNHIDDISDQDISESQYNNGDGEMDSDQEQVIEEGGVIRRRKKVRRQKKKPLDDIRLPSEQIYLQRLQAPHQKKKNIRKKKKKNNASSMQQLQPMDEDNQVYDLDF